MFKLRIKKLGREFMVGRANTKVLIVLEISQGTIYGSILRMINQYTALHCPLSFLRIEVWVWSDALTSPLTKDTSWRWDTLNNIINWWNRSFLQFFTGMEQRKTIQVSGLSSQLGENGFPIHGLRKIHFVTASDSYQQRQSAKIGF